MIKTSLLALCLCLSIGLNAGLLVALGQKRFAERRLGPHPRAPVAAGELVVPPAMRRFVASLGLEGEEREGFVRRHRRLAEGLRLAQRSGAVTRQRLLDELFADQPERARIDSLLGDLERQNQELDRELIELVLSVRAVLDGEQEERYERLLRRGFLQHRAVRRPPGS